MRVWDLPPSVLCRSHLLGEHREVHCIWTVLTQGRRGYSQHPEVQRWRGRLAALFTRHSLLVEEMTDRGWKHSSPLDELLAVGEGIQEEFLATPDEQVLILRGKGCNCKVGGNQT